MSAFSKEQLFLQNIAVFMGLCAGVVMVLLCSLTLWLAYGDDDPPFVSVKARVLDAYGQERYVFRAGEVMQIRRDFCVERTTPVEVGREFRNTKDNSALLMESSNQVYRKGCSEGGNIVQIPAFAPAGKYEYRVAVTYSNNPLRRDSAYLAPVTVEIVK